MRLVRGTSKLKLVKRAERTFKKNNEVIVVGKAYFLPGLEGIFIGFVSRG